MSWSSITLAETHIDWESGGMGGFITSFPPVANKKSQANEIMRKKSSAIVPPPKAPPSLLQLARDTHFTRQEIRTIYRAFKEVASNAIIHRDMVRHTFAHIFPRADTEHFADLIFNAFDTDQAGAITFDASFSFFLG